MKKFIRNSLCLALATMSVMATACTSEMANTLPPYDTTEYTEYYLAKDGKTDYSILIEDDASEREIFAAAELQKLFKEATGATLPIKTEELTFSEDAKVISIGDTEFQKGSGVEVSYAEFKTSGARIVNKGSSVICLGAEDEGSLYSAYDLLDILFDYEFFDVDGYRLNKKSTVQLPVIDWTNIPDFDFREFGDYSHENSVGGDYHDSWRRRFWYQPNSAIISGHTAAQIIPLETYYTPEHEDWFYHPTGSDWQLCYSNEEMRLEYVEQLKRFINKKPDGYRIYMTDNDVPSWCDCDKCEATIAKYSPAGQHVTTATLIPFVNKVVADIDAWLEDNYPDRRVEYVTYAYQGAKFPPAQKNSKGEYEPVGAANGDYSMKLTDRVLVQYASVEANRNKAFKEDATEREFLLAWASLTNNLMIYEYPQDAYHSLLPYDGMHTHTENIRFAKELGHTAYRFQGNYNTQSSGFYNLRIYVISKLLWDSTLDPNKLVEDYFTGVYGEAAGVMMELYQTMRDKLAYLREKTGYGDNCLKNNLGVKNYSRPMMRRYEELIFQAYEKIEDLKYINAEEYERIFRKIKIEQMWIDYVNLSLYPNYYTPEVRKQMIDDFEMYAGKYGIKCWNQTVSIAVSIEAWRKA